MSRVPSGPLQDAVLNGDWRLASELAARLAETDPLSVLSVIPLRQDRRHLRDLVEHCVVLSGIERWVHERKLAWSDELAARLRETLAVPDVIDRAIAVERLGAWCRQDDEQTWPAAGRAGLDAHRRAIALDGALPRYLRARAARHFLDDEPAFIVEVHRRAPLPGGLVWQAFARGAEAEGVDVDAVAASFVLELRRDPGQPVAVPPEARGTDVAVEIAVCVLELERARAEELVPWLVRHAAGRLALLVRLEHLDPQHVAQVLRSVDVEEAFDAIGDAWRRGPTLRPVLVWNGLLGRDERFLDLALSTMDEDPTWSLQLLACHSSPRARQEIEQALRSLRERGVDVSAAVAMLPPALRAAATSSSS